MEETNRFTLNGKSVTISGEMDRSLLWVLRTDLQLTGTKYGCGESYCGACTVLLNGKAVRSCQLTIRDVVNQEVTTIEGLASNGVLHPVQEAFVEHDAVQCGFCTPGMVLTAVSFLKKNPDPTKEEIVAGMEDNLCRCGGYQRIVQALVTASQKMQGRTQ
jgi:aerobic-type carbon monoxide dehydrogenase small subunit (CoxS/CutS family)